MTAAIQTYDPHTGAMTLAQAQGQYNALVEFTKSVLKDGLDYGKVPGVSKPSLLKPGAEKLSMLYRLRPSFELVTCREDWDAGFFYYHYRCKLTRDGEFMGEAEGSCNTREKKYRYRNADRLCPSCGQPQIRRSKEEWGGGYYCNQKTGGCGAKFTKGSAEFKTIDAQDVGQVENPDIYDTVNTVQKMAQKRALVAAVLITTGASEFFTQDVEDLQVVNVDATLVVQEAKPLPAPAPEGQTIPAQVSPRTRKADVTREVQQAAGTPAHTTKTPPNDVALERVQGMAERVKKYGAQDVQDILDKYDWRGDMEACKATYSELLAFGKAHAEPPAQVPAQPPQSAPAPAALALIERKLAAAPYEFTAAQHGDMLAFVAWLVERCAPLAALAELTVAEQAKAASVLGNASVDGAALLEKWNVTRNPPPPARPNRVGDEPVQDAEFHELLSLEADEDMPF